MDLFTYGTLMSPDIMARVAGCRLASVPARLAGYRRTLVLDEVYPGIVEDEGCVVDGILYLGAPEEAISRLDAFEGEMYDRREVGVTMEGGETRTVMTYVFRPEYRSRLTDIPWDYQRFLASGKERFETGYSGFDKVV
ncbi:MAG: gamma-glutamylcyclotransferase [Desulfobulbaceae bacterium]|nr:MAG: gamma-glutamylcyclotransferase [Desulfobulbaceae bacterium]